VTEDSVTAPVSRRSVLLGACATCAVIVTGCAGSGTGTPSARRSPSSPPGPLVALDEIPVGQAVAATGADRAPIVVARPTSTTAAAFSAICTHQGCRVKPVGRELDCPCHGSVFDATTGRVLHGPARRPLPTVPVVVRDGQVFLA